MEKIKKYSPYLAIPVIFFIAFTIGDNNSKNVAFDSQCKFEEITPALIKKIGGDYSDENMIRQINEETPYCRDFCLQQLEYSKKYDDWFAENDLRKTCTDLGISLPVK